MQHPLPKSTHTAAAPGVEVASDNINPTVRRRRLGSELRKLREGTGMTAEAVAAKLLVSQSKISRLENGRRSISPRDVRDLCEAYGVTDESHVEGLMNMARESRQRGWWHAYGDLPYSVYIGLEQEASQIRSYESLLIPGLLQTRDYAYGCVDGIEPDKGREAILRRVEVRMRRQERIVLDEEPAEFWSVIDEAALHRVVGGRGVMRQQMEQLLNYCELPHVNLQVIAYEAGAHPGMSGAFSILEFSESADTAVVYLEGVTTDVYLEKEADVRRYTGLYTHLQASALSVGDTRSLIARLAKEYAE